MSWSVSQCWVLNDLVACIRREGPMSVGSERDERKSFQIAILKRAGLDGTIRVRFSLPL